MNRIENSPGLELALLRAKSIALGAGVEAVQPFQLLQGLLAEEEGPPFRILSRAGADLASLSAPAETREAREEAQTFPISAAVRHILKRARQTVPWHSAEGTITTDLVLLALLEREESLRERLIALGLDWERLAKDYPLQAPSLELDEPLHLEEGPTSAELARLLDAAANRAREALRVLEDYTRFVLDDAFLTRELKNLRHALVALLEPLTLPFLHARATLDDVGTGISTSQEQQRGSLRDVVLANSKRLQEALRSLEEFGKIHSTPLGQGIEQLRYRAYTLERALVPGAEAREKLEGARLYVLVTEKLCRASWIGTVRELLEGGADVIQLREKELDDRTLLQRARAIRAMTRDHGALFLVNDRPDIALLSEADGVHLGQDDLPLAAARRLLHAGPLIGISTHDLEQVRRAVLEGAGYLGVGPTFPSRTKTFTELAGLDFVRAARQETSLPAFALGGITLENLDQVIQAGAKRVAVSHALCSAEDPRAAAAAMKRRLNHFA